LVVLCPGFGQVFLRVEPGSCIGAFGELWSDTRH
jgi:hypothetical protein